MNNNENTPLPGWHERHHEEKSALKTKQERTNLIIRNILNLIFMIGAVAGVICHFYYDKQKGMYIILAAMAFKFIESAIRASQQRFLRHKE